MKRKNSWTGTTNRQNRQCKNKNGTQSEDTGMKKTRTDKKIPATSTNNYRLTFSDLITSMNLVAGIFALFAALLGKTTTAIVLVAAAMLFDLFDGRIARYLKQEHALGRELDSLSDIVSFGVAPGIIALVIYQKNELVLVVAVLFALAAAYRLARFNLLAEKGVTHFVGLPVPAAAFLLLLAARFFVPVTMPWLFALIGILLAALMVSTIRIKKIS